MALSEQAEAWMDWARSHRGGALVEELAKLQAEVVLGVVELGEPGSLGIKLTIKPVKGNADQVLTEDTVTVKIPQERSDTSWVGVGGLLTFREARAQGFKLLRDGSGLMSAAPPPDDTPRLRRDLE